MWLVHAPCTYLCNKNRLKVKKKKNWKTLFGIKKCWGREVLMSQVTANQIFMGDSIYNKN